MTTFNFWVNYYLIFFFFSNASYQLAKQKTHLFKAQSPWRNLRFSVLFRGTPVTQLSFAGLEPATFHYQVLKFRHNRDHSHHFGKQALLRVHANGESVHEIQSQNSFFPYFLIKRLYLPSGIDFQGHIFINFIHIKINNSSI